MDAELVIWDVDLLARLRKLDEADDVMGFGALLVEEGSLRALSTGLIGEVIRRFVVPEHAWESLLTRVRTALLHVAYNESDPEHPLFVDPALACVLAQQCWLNGFVFSRTSQEEIISHRLGERLLAFDSSEDPADVARLSVLACYDGLLEWRLEAEAVALAKIHASDPFVDLLMLQVAEPMAESEIADGLESVGEISREVSTTVRERYKDHPYPRWVPLDVETPSPVAVKMSEWLPGVDFSDQVHVEAPRILVAGCGTGRSLARAYSDFANATVTGVDPSRRCLAYASRMMAESGLDETELYHADVRSLTDWVGPVADGGRRFDIIYAGELHHTEDPMAAWRVLEGLLEHGGLMRMSLPSEPADEALVKAREFIAEKRLGSTPGDIRTLRQRVLTGELPWQDLLSGREFWSLGECRDLLFPIQEHLFTISQLEQRAGELGLEVIGFEEAYPGEFVGRYRCWMRKPGARAE